MLKWTLPFIVWLVALLLLEACDFNYQPQCQKECAAGGGDDAFGAGAPIKGE